MLRPASIVIRGPGHELILEIIGIIVSQKNMSVYICQIIGSACLISGNRNRDGFLCSIMERNLTCIGICRQSLKIGQSHFHLHIVPRHSFLRRAYSHISQVAALVSHQMFQIAFAAIISCPGRWCGKNSPCVIRNSLYGHRGFSGILGIKLYFISRIPVSYNLFSFLSCNRAFFLRYHSHIWGKGAYKSCCIALWIQNDFQHCIFQSQIAVTLLIGQIGVAVFILLSIYCKKFRSPGKPQKICNPHQGFHSFFRVCYLIIIKSASKKGHIPFIVIQKFCISLIHLTNILFLKLRNIVVLFPCGSLILPFPGLQ